MIKYIFSHSNIYVTQLEKNKGRREHQMLIKDSASFSGNQRSVKAKTLSFSEQSPQQNLFEVFKIPAQQPPQADTFQKTAPAAVQAPVQQTVPETVSPSFDQPKTHSNFASYLALAVSVITAGYVCKKPAVILGKAVVNKITEVVEPLSKEMTGIKEKFSSLEEKFKTIETKGISVVKEVENTTENSVVKTVAEKLGLKHEELAQHIDVAELEKLHQDADKTKIVDYLFSKPPVEEHIVNNVIPAEVKISLEDQIKTAVPPAVEGFMTKLNEKGIEGLSVNSRNFLSKHFNVPIDENTCEVLKEQLPPVLNNPEQKNKLIEDMINFNLTQNHKAYLIDNQVV